MNDFIPIEYTMFLGSAIALAVVSATVGSFVTWFYLKKKKELKKK